jgi:hypothetical protein
MYEDDFSTKRKSRKSSTTTPTKKKKEQLKKIVLRLDVNQMIKIYNYQIKIAKQEDRILDVEDVFIKLLEDHYLIEEENDK